MESSWDSMSKLFFISWGERNFQRMETCHQKWARVLKCTKVKRMDNAQMGNAHVSESLHRCRWTAISWMARDQYGEGSVNHKMVDVIGERHSMGRLNHHLVQGREWQTESRMTWTYLFGLRVWMSLEGSSFQFNTVPKSSHYLLFIDVSSLPLENISAHNPWLVKSFYFIDEILSLEGGTSSLMKHVLLVIILRRHLLILVHNLFIISLPSSYFTA